MENIGEIIKKKIAEKGIKITDFAEALNCDRTNVYSIFNRENIDLQLLTKISQILGYDFLSVYQKNNPDSKYVVLIKIDDSKMQEIQHDSCIEILHIENV